MCIPNKTIGYPIDRVRAVAFTGHRNLGKIDSMDDGSTERIACLIREKVCRLYGLGYRIFLCGMAPGFDILAAEVVLGLKQTGYLPELELVAVIPFPGQGVTDDPRYNRRWWEAIGAAAHVHCVGIQYYKRCFLDRNDVMLKHVSAVVCWWDGRLRSGTGYTVRRALGTGLAVFNLMGVDPDRDRR